MSEQILRALLRDERERGRAEVLAIAHSHMRTSEADELEMLVLEALAIERPGEASGLRAQRRGGKSPGLSTAAARAQQSPQGEATEHVAG